ncbi:hypothetical protein [Bacteroides sp.]
MYAKGVLHPGGETLYTRMEEACRPGWTSGVHPGGGKKLTPYNVLIMSQSGWEFSIGTLQARRMRVGECVPF